MLTNSMGVMMETKRTSLTPTEEENAFIFLSPTLAFFLFVCALLLGYLLGKFE